VLVVAGLFSVRTDRDDPTGVALVYAVDKDRGAAWLTGYGASARANEWVRRSLRASASGRSDSVPLPQWLTRGFDASRTIQAPVPDWTPTPVVEVVADSTTAEGRRVLLRVRPDRGVRVITIGTDAEVLRAAVDGIPVDSRGYRSRRRNWILEYVAAPQAGFELALTFRAGARPTLGVQGHLDVIPRLEGFSLPERPEGLLPFHSGNTSLVYLRVQL
jgi:hypothetical protein